MSIALVLKKSALSPSLLLPPFHPPASSNLLVLSHTHAPPLLSSPICTEIFTHSISLTYTYTHCQSHSHCRVYSLPLTDIVEALRRHAHPATSPALAHVLGCHRVCVPGELRTARVLRPPVGLAHSLAEVGDRTTRSE